MTLETLSFRKHPFWPVLWIAFALTICTKHLQAETNSSSRTNVLFIAADDMKPLLGCYGDSTAITPAMDRLASEGMVFTTAHCQWPVCGPSRASLMSSLRPEANGVMNLKTDIRAKNPDILTLPQHFRNHGYMTAGAGKIYDPRCVDSKKTLDEPSWSVPFVKIRHGELKHDKVERFALAPVVEDIDLVDGQIARSGIKLLKKASRSDQPFFVAVGFKKPHLPFVAPKKYWDLYDRNQFVLAEHQGGIKDASGYTIHDGSELRGYEDIPESGPISDSLQREAIHGYYACISYVDAQVGLLLDELDRLGLTKNTHIVLWGDHGFHLGDHSMWGKHSTLEQATRVPLIFKPCNGVATGKSKAPVEFTDIFPTLCDLTGLPVPNTINGRSLAGILNGESAQVRDGALTVFKSRGCIGYSYRTERHRLTQWIKKTGKTAATELYDYETDPSESQNLAGKPTHADVQAKLEKQLRADAQGCDRLLQGKQ
jgi:arylsulfatase A-like enzyme